MTPAPAWWSRHTYGPLTRPWRCYGKRRCFANVGTERGRKRRGFGSSWTPLTRPAREIPPGRRVERGSAATLPMIRA